MTTIHSFIAACWHTILLLLFLLVFNQCSSSKSSNEIIAENYVSVGIAHYKNGDSYLAITAWKNALDVSPDDAEVHNFIGIAYEKLNALDSAIAHFKSATELDKDYHQAFNNLGYAYFMNKNYSDAERCFESSLQKKSNYAPAVLNLKKIREILARIRVSDSLSVIASRGTQLAHKINIAILNLDPINISKETALALTLRLRSDIRRSGQYNLLRREKMKEILQKQGFQFSGCTSDECLLEAGELLQVQQIIGGTISNDGPDYAFKLRLVNIDSGEVIAKVTEKIKAQPRYALTKGIKQVAQKLSNLSKYH